VNPFENDESSKGDLSWADVCPNCGGKLSKRLVRSKELQIKYAGCLLSMLYPHEHLFRIGYFLGIADPCKKKLGERSKTRLKKGY
jgi:hypothetical protein